MPKAAYIVAIAAGAVLSAGATKAEVKTIYDPGQNKFITIDLKEMKQKVRAGSGLGPMPPKQQMNTQGLRPPAALASRPTVAAPRVAGAASRAYTPIVRETVAYDGPYGANTIIVNTAERRLYFVFEDGRAYKYGIGVGREGFQWSGKDKISRKAEWPGWTPPPQMIKREAAKGRKLPAYMPGGPNNPLGARALYIGSSLFRIHGSNEPWTIGHAVSSGCIRMTNDDVTDLYDKVSVGTKVVVL